MNVQVSIKGFEDVPSKDGHDGHVEYIIVVSIISHESLKSKDTTPEEIVNSWTVKRRFNDFYDLHTALKSQGYKNIIAFNFPSRRVSVLQSKSSLASHRRQVLEQYLREILRMTPIPPEVLSFLEIDMKTHDSSPRHMSAQQVKELASNSGKSRDSMHDVFGALSYLNPVNVISNITSTIQSPKNNKDMNILEDTKLEKTLSKIFSQPLDPMDHKMLIASMLIICVATSIAAMQGVFISLLTPLKSTVAAIIYMRNILIRFRVGLESTIAVLIVLMTVHRIFGYLMTQYLQAQLRAPDGSYNITVDWISLRIGLDRNEVIFKGLTFHNPPLFTQTPYFIRIEQITFVVDIMSIIDVFIFHNKRRAIKIYHWELDGIDFYIEKGIKRSYGMNLWAALGAMNEDQEKDVQTYVFQAMSAASNISIPMKNLFGRSNPNAKAKNDDDVDDEVATANSIASAAESASTLPPTSSTFLPSFLSSPVASMRLPSLSSSSTPAASKIPLSSVNAAASEAARETEADLNYSSIYHLTDDHNDDDIIDEDNEEDANDDTWKEIPSDDDETHENVKKPSSSDPNTPSSESESKSTSVAANTKGWGVPYIFEVDRLSVHDFKLHAQDFLTAQHVDTKTASYISIDAINMNRRDLTKPPNKKHKNRRGLYLDELSWRLIYRTVAELFRTNQISMITIVAAATVNQTTNAVLDVAKMASQGVSNAVYNYNPLQILETTRKTIQKVITAKEQIARSPSVTLLGVTSLKVRIIKLRDVIMADGRTPATMKCMMRLKYASDAIGEASSPRIDEQGNTELMKSSALTKDRENEISYNETFYLEPLISLDGTMHLRVYEAGLFGTNNFACEMYLSIRPSLVSCSRNLVKSPSGSSIPAVDTKSNTKQGNMTDVTPSATNIGCIGVKDEVATWHNLYGKNENKDTKLGEIRLGLSLV